MQGSPPSLSGAAADSPVSDVAGVQGAPFSLSEAPADSPVPDENAVQESSCVTIVSLHHELAFPRYASSSSPFALDAAASSCDEGRAAQEDAAEASQASHALVETAEQHAPQPSLAHYSSAPANTTSSPSWSSAGTTAGQRYSSDDGSALSFGHSRLSDDMSSSARPAGNRASSSSRQAGASSQGRASPSMLGRVWSGLYTVHRLLTSPSVAQPVGASSFSHAPSSHAAGATFAAGAAATNQNQVHQYVPH